MRTKPEFVTFPWHTDSAVGALFGILFQVWMIIGLPVYQWVAEKPFSNYWMVFQIVLIMIFYLLLYWLHRNPVREGMRDGSVG